ncbi:MAG: hypothetical protein KC978_09540, partial [Candidatus Omnitrophica bacterium]|nr:hypothetical protein [Candidatus Omnitrophota bacterium]
SQVWIDDVELTQDLPDLRNLVHNPSFEIVDQESGHPSDWDPPVEDEWISWVGAQYRSPLLDSSSSSSGTRSMRASVTYADISGLSQVVHLDQEKPNPIIVGIRSKLDNSIGKGPPGYYGPDNLANLILYVHHQDGTMQEVSPTFCLGESDHDWDYRRGAFLPEKPVDFIRLQITVVGTEPTTSLWIDDIELFELAEDSSRLPSVKLAPPRTLVSDWGESPIALPDRITAANDDNHLFLSIPANEDSEEITVVLNPLSESPFPDHHRYLYPVIRLGRDGKAEIGKAVDKQGYVKFGLFNPCKEEGISSDISERRWTLSIPFRSIGLDQVSDLSLGLNVQWSGAGGERRWNGKGLDTVHLGRLILAQPPHLALQSVRFGNRWETMTDQSQDWVTHPPVYSGANRATLNLYNPTAGTEFELRAGIEGRPDYQGSIEIPTGETKELAFDYDAGHGGMTEFEIDVRSGDESILSTSFPLVVPAPIEAVLSQEFYYDRETSASAEIHTRYSPLPKEGRLEISIIDQRSGGTVFSGEASVAGATTVIEFPLDGIRTNDLPVQDYYADFRLVDSNGEEIGSATAPFGRIHPTQRKPLPPIQTVEADERGMLVLNGNFRFFPIAPSLRREERLEAIRLGANVNRGIYHSRSNPSKDEPDIFEDTEATWKLGAYTLPVGPGPEAMEDFRKEADELLAHPGFLGCYPKQFYYWNLPPEFDDYRREIEKIFRNHKNHKLIVWGHHDSSLLYDLDQPQWPFEDPTVGYCFVKIMSRPGSAWRNAPLLTLTEQILNPNRFKMAEVNGYVSWSNDEIVPEHFLTYLSLRADRLKPMRNEAYLAVIYGANGLYQYLTHQSGGLQRYRGWFQELDFMWSIFVADDADPRVEVTPVESGIETRLKHVGGKYYLLTANASERDQSAEIHIEGLKGMSVKKLFDLPGKMALEGDTLHDVWSKDDAFVYEIEAPAP